MKSEAEWEKTLSPEAYQVLRRKATEPPFSGQYYRNSENGIYYCGACGSPLFNSETKLASGCGWPSFYAPLNEGGICTEVDHSHGMVRTEVKCAKCGSHLGHVFNDGPKPTGQRYCINSVALDFKRKSS